MKIFVSYTTIDKEITIQFLQTIHKSLTNIGSVFIDLLNNNSVDKQGRVFYELEQSDLLVLVNSKNINNSFWVSKEIERAENIGIPKLTLFQSELRLLPEAKLKKKITNALINNTATNKSIVQAG